MLLLGLAPSLGPLYFLPAALVTGYLLQKNVALLREPTRSRARRMFLASNVYLLVVLLSIPLALVIGA